MRAHRPTTVQGAAAVAVGFAALAASCGAAAPAVADVPSVDLGPISHCESGDNPTAHNPGSSASGLYQFLTSSWLAYGGGRYAPTAGQATPAQQTEIANAAFAASGLTPWAASQSCWGGQTAAILSGHTTVPAAPVPAAPKPAPKRIPVAADMVLTAPTTPTETPKPAPVPPRAPVIPMTGATHTVVSGDTLWGIAPGHHWQALYQRNHAVVGDDADLIFPGQQLKL